MKEQIQKLINHYEQNIDTVSYQIKQLEIRNKNTNDIGEKEIYYASIKEHKRDKQNYVRFVGELKNII